MRKVYCHDENTRLQKQNMVSTRVHTGDGLLMVCPDADGHADCGEDTMFSTLYQTGGMIWQQCLK